MWMRKIAACVVAMGVSATAWAAAPGDAEVEELLQVSRVPELINSMLQGMEKEFSENAKMFAEASGAKSGAAQSQRAKDMRRKMVQIMREELAWEKVQPIYRQIYKETFTQEEVAGMLAFYRTPVGQSVLQKTPKVMERSMQITRERLMPNLMRRLAQAMSEKAGAADTKGAAPASSQRK